MEHELKTVEPYFSEVWNDRKNFECRLNDRDFKSGDTVKLKQYDPEFKVYGDRFITGEIGFILTDEFPGVAKGYVVFSLINLTNFKPF